MYLDLISFAQLNKKGLRCSLSRYGQHGRLIPQAMLVPCQVVEITVRTASTACLQGGGSKDKKKCVVSGGKHALQYLFCENADAIVIFHGLAGRGGLSWVS